MGMQSMIRKHYEKLYTNLIFKEKKKLLKYTTSLKLCKKKSEANFLKPIAIKF